MGDNLLTKLPDEIGQMTDLQVLSLNTNNLSRLPATLTSLTNLKKVSLFGNRFTEFPKILLNMTWLTCIDVAMNNFKTLPWGIETFPTFQDMVLDPNDVFTDSPEIVEGKLKPVSSRLSDLCTFVLEKTQCESCGEDVLKSRAIQVIKPVAYRNTLVKTEAHFCSKQCKDKAISAVPAASLPPRSV